MDTVTLTYKERLVESTKRLRDFQMRFEGFPADLNRRDSQGVSNGRFFVY